MRRVNSFDSNTTTDRLVAPNTLRMPISLVRCCTVKAVKPKRPKTGEEHGESGEDGEDAAHVFLRVIQGV